MHQQTLQALDCRILYSLSGLCVTLYCLFCLILKTDSLHLLFWEFSKMIGHHWYSLINISIENI